MSLRPLQGYRVLDLTNVLSGPFCCHQLAHLGAEVIKVEIPNGGDLARQLGVDPDLNAKNMGISFLAQNAGKKSLTLNFKKPRDKEIFLKLVKTADVVVENFRPGVMDRLGLGYEELRSQQPGLIYCAISGFGQDGPLSDHPAYDQIIQGYSGIMSITGEPDGGRYRVGYPVCDTIGGMTAAFAISSALAQKDRSQGCYIDVSMLEATMATMGWVISNYLIGGKAPQALGNENFTSSPSGTFRTQDAPINISANKQQQFESVCQIIGRVDLIEDVRFAGRQARLANRFELKAILEGVLITRPAQDWLALLNQYGVPAGPVTTVPEALGHPQIAERGMIGEFKNVDGIDRDIKVVKTGFKINGTTPSVDSPPPTLGQHNEELLRELGCFEEMPS